MPDTTTRTTFLDRTVAIRADWDDEASTVMHLVQGRWIATTWRVSDVDDHRAALRLELRAMALAVGKDPADVRGEIIAALEKAQSK